MKVSIITVSYNAVNTIENTILSVLSQTYPDIEYLIIDGGSTDGTKEILRKYESKITRLIIEPDKGIYDAMNKGIAIASGSLIGCLNADDVYANENIILHLVELITKEKTDCAYGDLIYVKDEKIIRFWKSGSFRSSKFRYGWMPPHPTFFVKKEVYTKWGLFDIDFKISADYELMLRFLFRHKISVSYLPEVMVKMNVGGVSNANIKNRMLANNEDKQAWRKNGLRTANYTFLLKPLRKLPQFRFW